MNTATTQGSARRTMTLLALAAVVVAGCGGSGPTSRDSGIEGVPVPAEAQQIDRSRDFRFFEVPTMSYEEVVAWYDAVMPVRRDFRNWRLCAADEQREFDGRINFRVYERGVGEALALGIFDDADLGVVIMVLRGDPALEAVEEEC